MARVGASAIAAVLFVACLRRIISQCERLFRQAFDESPGLSFAALNWVSHVPRSGRAGPGDLREWRTPRAQASGRMGPGNIKKPLVRGEGKCRAGFVIC